MEDKTEIILGPPGTGKTTRLIGMVEKTLAEGVAPDRVGYISFTKRAAEEARDRAMEKFGLTAKQLPWFRTIHSLCFAALGLSSSEVLEGPRLKEFGDWIGVDVTGVFSTEEGGTFGYMAGDRCLFMENLARVRGIPLRQQYEEDSDNLSWMMVDRVSRGLEEFKRKKGLHDFTDMLTEFVKFDWNGGIEVLFVDEAQDLSRLQWAVVNKIAVHAKRVIVAGDDDQAIYRWAGADVEHFVSLPGRSSVLEQSWRVPRSVQTTAMELIGRIRHRRDKSWKPRDDDGAVARVGAFDMLDVNAGEDLLILSRNLAHLREDVMPSLRSQGILYDYRGNPSVKRSIVDGILNWEKLRRGERITVAQAIKMYDLLEVDYGVQRGHKKLPFYTNKEDLVGMAELRANGGLLLDAIWHDALTKLTVQDRVYMTKALRRGEKLTSNPTVRLSTIHGSKGGQADHVVLLTDVAWRTKRESAGLHEDEARTFYVGVTRAKSRLTIVSPQTRHSYDV